MGGFFYKVRRSQTRRYIRITAAAAGALPRRHPRPDPPPAGSTVSDLSPKPVPPASRRLRDKTSGQKPSPQSKASAARSSPWLLGQGSESTTTLAGLRQVPRKLAGAGRRADRLAAFFIVLRRTGRDEDVENDSGENHAHGQSIKKPPRLASSRRRRNQISRISWSPGWPGSRGRRAGCGHPGPPFRDRSRRWSGKARSRKA